MALGRPRTTSGGWIVLERVSGPAIGFVLNLTLARILSLADLGRFYVALSVAQSIAVVWQLGTPEVLVHAIAGERRRLKPAATLSLVICVAAACLSLAPLINVSLRSRITLLAAKADIEDLAGIILLWGGVLAFRSVISSSLLAVRDYLWSAISGTTIASLLMLFGVGVWMLASEENTADTRLIALTGVSAALTTVLLGAGRTFVAYKGSDWRAFFASWKVSSFGSKSFVQGISNLGIVVLNQVDIWVLGIALAPESVGLYGAAARLMLLARLPMLVGSLIAQPVVARLWSTQSMKRLQEYITTMSRRIALTTLAIAIVFGSAASELLGVVFGPEFRHASRVLQILLAGQAINGLSGLGAVVLAMTGRQVAMAALTLASAAFSVAAVLFAAQTGSVEWIAAAAAASVAIQNIGAARVARTTTTVRVWSLPGM